MWVLGVYVYLAVFYLIKKIDVNSIYKVIDVYVYLDVM